MFTGKNKLLLFSAILLGAFLIISCGTQPVGSPTPGKTELPVTTSTPTVVPTNTPAVTPTETATIEPTPTTPPFTRCQEIIDAQLPKDFLTEGSIIFIGECEGKQGLYKLSAATQKLEPFLDKELKDGYFIEFNVSNDHQWLAIGNPSYDESGQYVSSSLIVTGEDDKTLIQYPENRNWSYLEGWLGNQRVQISSWVMSDNILLNPFSGKVHLQPNAGGIAYFDAQPTRVLYFDELSQQYVLKDTKNDRKLWHSKGDITKAIYNDEHHWSPNDAQVAFPIWESKNSNFFRFIVVSREGKEVISDPIQSFGYTGYFGQAMVRFGWSADGKYLIYWNGVKSGENQLVYWNPTTGEIINSGFVTKDNDPDFPDFSPNGQKFILSAAESSEENAPTVNYLVDLASSKVSKLDILSPLVWLKTELEITMPVKEPYPLPPQNGVFVKQACAQTQASIGNPTFDGGLVFFRKDHLYLSTYMQGTRELIDTEFRPAMTAYVSPNQKWLFYWYQDKDWKRHYWLYALNGQPTEVVTKEIHSEYVADEINGWQNNDELWVVTNSYGSNGYDWLFNPFKNSFRNPPEFKFPPETQDVQLCWVYCRSAGDPPTWLYNHFDTAFERHVYIAFDSLIMQDQNGNILWRSAKHTLVGFNMPKWSPDDQKLGVPLPKDEFGEHYEIFTVDRNGHQYQLTNYSAAYPTMTIDKFSWSPNGRYIAFWGDTHSQENIAQQNPYRLFVLDTTTRQTIDYCIPGSYSSQYTQNRAPVWSPDGSQIAVENVQSGKSMIMLVDFTSGTVSPVAEGKLVGWMANP
jgi:Tol biopolymer transport system component